MKYNRISADCHLDLCCLPPDLFVSEATAEFKDRVPHVVEGPDGPYWIDSEGANFGLVNGASGLGSKYVKGKHHRLDVMAETGLYEDGRKGIRRVGDPHLRLKEMERDGVDAEVIYGVLAVALMMKDKEALNEVLRIYNDWVTDFCSHYPDRQIGLACIPPGDVDLAVGEVHRVARLGLRGIELPCQWDMKPLWHSDWEPLWKAISDVDLPIHFHAFPSVPTHHFFTAAPERRSAANFATTSCFQISLFHVMAGIIGAGVLERYPNIRVGFGEGGLGWIPYALDRMDYQWEDRFKFQDMGLKMKPSDYWRRQCRASFQYEEIGSKLIDYIGADTLMWGSDFPHGDGVWPESGEYIAKQFSHLPESDVRKITCDNAVQFYRLN
jgi:predicted TIM-barrel fold metal-dependent hydrolase